MVIGMRQSFAKCKSKCVCDRTEPKPSPITDWSEPNPNWTLAEPKPNLNWKTDWNERRRNLQCRCKCRQSSPAVVRPTVHSEEKFRRKIYLHDPTVTRRFGYVDEYSRAESSASAAAISGQTPAVPDDCTWRYSGCVAIMDRIELPGRVTLSLTIGRQLVTNSRWNTCAMFRGLKRKALLTT